MKADSHKVPPTPAIQCEKCILSLSPRKSLSPSGIQNMSSSPPRNLSLLLALHLLTPAPSRILESHRGKRDSHRDFTSPSHPVEPGTRRTSISLLHEQTRLKTSKSTAAAACVLLRPPSPPFFFYRGTLPSRVFPSEPHTFLFLTLYSSSSRKDVC